MRTYDGAVDHQVLIVPVGRQRIKDPFPYASMTQPAEPAMDRFPFAIPLRQIPPVRARA